MKLDRRIAVAAACVMLVSLTQCKHGITAPVAARTHSVTTTMQVPAVPTAPITLSTNDPESHVQVILDVATLQQLVQAAGGPVTIKMTDLAPVDFGTVPASEQAKLGNPREVADLVFDVTTTSGGAVRSAVASRSADLKPLFDQTGQGTTTFAIRNNTGKRCTPGKVDLVQIFGSNSTLLTSSILIDDANPLQNITGSSSSATFAIRHFIFCFECPRVIPPTGGGLVVAAR